MSKLEKGAAGPVSHAYIVSALSREESLEKAREIAATALCSQREQAPCGSCRNCRKVENGTHPDLLFIRRLTDDKGKPKRDISVDQVRGMISDAHVLPNEAEGKVFIVEEAELMNPSAQNAALKLLEEPPKGVVIILCTLNAERLLPTVRSRCAEIVCAQGKSTADEETLKLSSGYLKAVAGGDAAKLLRWCCANEGVDNRQAQAFVDCTTEQLADMLCGRKADMGIPALELMRLCSLMDRCSEYLKVNTGIKHIFGLLAVKSLPRSGNRG